MSKTVIFRDRQEVQEGDLNNVGGFAREAMDRIVREGMTDEKKFSGFSVAKTGATVVTIAPGTYWANGQRFIRESPHEIDFLSQLPLVTKRIVAIIVTGQAIETDIQPRDFIIDVDTGATEPDSVAMQSLRYAEFQTAVGTENATPQKPTVSSDTLVIAWVTLSTTGVDGIEKATENEIMSNKRLAQRATALELWRREAGEQITTLGSDLSNLANRVGDMADSSVLIRIFSDVASIKEALELDDGFAGYGSENFLVTDQGITDDQASGYYASVEEGLRPPNDNAIDVAITLFNPLDPSVKVASNGLCLPKYSEVQRLALESFHQQLSLSQYEFQEIEYKTIAMSAQRLRFGLAKTVCNNSEFWRTGSFDARTGIFRDRLGRTYQALDAGFSRSFENSSQKFLRIQEFWYDEEDNSYEERVTTDHVVNGSMVAQTYLNTQGGWITSLDLFFTQVASTGNVRMLLTRTTGGKPDLDRVIREVSVDASELVQGSDSSIVGEWTRVPLVPTYLEAGGRYAIVLITGGNHFVGLTSGANYAAGTLFYSTDGAFFQGDLTLDLMFKTNFADFDNSRAEVDLGSLNLSGGINDIDIAYEGITPKGTDLHFEVRPQGSSRWYRLGAEEDNPFNGLPALVNFRAVFVGTKDLMPGLKLTGSSVTVSRPATTFTWFSEARQLPAPSQSIKVIVTLDYFNEANHDFDVVLNDITNTANDIEAATVTDQVLEEKDGTRKRIRRTFEWTSTELTTATEEIVIKATGTLAVATEMFHAERLVWMSF
ncbi:hypothetical protein [Roseinatronobacter sp.]